MSKMILNGYNQSDWVRYLMKTRQNDYVTNCICVVYAENETKLLWMIRPGMVCD